MTRLVSATLFYRRGDKYQLLSGHIPGLAGRVETGMRGMVSRFDVQKGRIAKQWQQGQMLECRAGKVTAAGGKVNKQNRDSLTLT